MRASLRSRRWSKPSSRSSFRTDAVSLLLAVLTAVVVSIAVIPLMIRLAPRLHMVDLPDPRKVHARPVPRVGGIGIALGTIVAVALLTRLDGWLAYYVTGSLV